MYPTSPLKGLYTTWGGGVGMKMLILWVREVEGVWGILSHHASMLRHVIARGWRSHEGEKTITPRLRIRPRSMGDVFEWRKLWVSLWHWHWHWLKDGLWHYTFLFSHIVRFWNGGIGTLWLLCQQVALHLSEIIVGGNSQFCHRAEMPAIMLPSSFYIFDAMPSSIVTGHSHGFLFHGGHSCLHLLSHCTVLSSSVESSLCHHRMCNHIQCHHHRAIASLVASQSYHLVLI